MWLFDVFLSSFGAFDPAALPGIGLFFVFILTVASFVVGIGVDSSED